MDEQKKSDDQDLTVSSDGSMTTGDQTADSSDTSASPVINDVTPPPAPDVSTGESIKVNVMSEPASESEPSADEQAVVSAPEESSSDSEATSDNPEPAPAPEPENTKENSSAVESKSDSPTEAPVALPPTEPIQASASTVDHTIDHTPAEMGVAASQMNKHPHRNNKKLAAIVTLIVALLLAGVAIYVYMGANNNATENKSTSSNTNSAEVADQKTVAQTPAKSTDVDTTSADVDQAINALDETADFAQDDLADATLGL